MLHTRIEADYRVSIPEKLRASLQIGEELLVKVDKAGNILLIPKTRALEILGHTAGMWEDRTDIPSEGTEYVNKLRQGHRLQDLRITSDAGD